ncbi:MAG: ribonuclease P protein component [Pseudomonadota bacterium]
MGLKTRAEFLAAAKGGKWAAKGVVVQARRHGRSDDEIGYGFTASRKVGGAVQRNRAKRRLRACAAIALDLGGCGGWDYVFIARGATLTRVWPSLVADAATGVLRAAAGARR